MGGNSIFSHTALKEFSFDSSHGGWGYIPGAFSGLAPHDAAGAFTGRGDDPPPAWLVYSISDSKVTILSWRSQLPADLNLPSTVFGLSVVAIGDNAFRDNVGVTSVEIPDSVTIIGFASFWNEPNLVSLKIGNSVASIGSYAFGNEGSLSSIDLPASVLGLADHAFMNDPLLTSMVIPRNVTTIGDWIFQNDTALGALRFLGPAPYVQGGNPFYGTPLKYFFYDGSQFGWTSIPTGFAGLLPIDISNGIPDTLPPLPPDYLNYSIVNGQAIITGLRNQPPSDLVIPASIGAFPVTAIGDNAFNGRSSITSVELPNTVTSIGQSSFQSMGQLHSVALPNSLISIGNYAFYNDSNLSSVVIPDLVVSMGIGVFAGNSSLSEITLGQGIQSVPQWAFFVDGALISIHFRGPAPSIGYQAMYGTPGGTAYFDSNQAGWSPNPPVIPGYQLVDTAPAGVPSPPSINSATAGPASARVAWTVSQSNGSPILGYSVSALDETTGINQPSACLVGSETTECNVAGLTNGDTYLMRVSSFNAVGTSNPSGPTRVTPVDVPSPPTLKGGGDPRESLSLGVVQRTCH